MRKNPWPQGDEPPPEGVAQEPATGVAPPQLQRAGAGRRTNLTLLSLSSDASGFLRDQPRAHGETDQTGDIEDVEPMHQLHPVVFDRLGA
jgi:hypothetical protein